MLCSVGRLPITGRWDHLSVVWDHPVTAVFTPLTTLHAQQQRRELLLALACLFAATSLLFSQLTDHHPGTRLKEGWGISRGPAGFLDDSTIRFLLEYRLFIPEANYYTCLLISSRTLCAMLSISPARAPSSVVTAALLHA